MIGNAGGIRTGKYGGMQPQVPNVLTSVIFLSLTPVAFTATSNVAAKLKLLKYILMCKCNW